MRILIVEDETPTAEDLKDIIADCLNGNMKSIEIEPSLQSALFYIKENPIDVLFLDLNLNGEDGFDILKTVVSKSFHTVVISANFVRAIEAFEYGVFDFIAKPYEIERIQETIDKLQRNNEFSNNHLRYLSVKEKNKVKIVPIGEISYFKAANVYVELIMKNGGKFIYDKNMCALSKILPPNYMRVHKSFIIRMDDALNIIIKSGGKYCVELKCGTKIPVSRQRYKEVLEFFELRPG
ncbi:MAG: LytTR family DNA-binding domain-containing protein [Ignavibacteria bacterium]|jgi:DNA-binding LytR/AlgR family response regulator